MRVILTTVESNRASYVKEIEYRITIHPGQYRCDDRIIEINPAANFTEPVLMKIDLEESDPAIDDSPIFNTKLVRLSEDSILHASQHFWVVRDCGSDFICTPNLVITLETFDSLIVGAPKAVSRVKNSIAPGQVLTCRLTNLDVQNITCYPLGMDDSEHDKSIRRLVNVRDFFRDDMWFGATIATVPEGKLFVCAPRWADPYKDKHLLANGACYVETKRRGIVLTPLKEMSRMAWKADGKRKEYGDYGTNMNFFAYGQAGMSIKVTENNSIIIGAPGLLQWSGGIVDYRFSPNPNSVFFNKQPIAIPYYTMELGPDDYFGYSVESGIFEANGSILYVSGAPRSKLGFGQVLIFEPPVRELDPLNIRAQVKGPQLGSYFGASLCCTDLNNDGLTDLLVGAPNFVTKEEEIPYDQGAVFVYLAGVSTGEVPSFVLKEAGHVSGSGQSGARFGNAIAALGDIDDDGYKDIAVGAPFENDGLGAVYIYRGSATGLKQQYVQRIVDEGARGFGISISKGLDVDLNNCNDLAVGAHNSATAYLYRCIPTIEVEAYIEGSINIDLPKNETGFSTFFCVRTKPKNLWPHVQLDMRVILTIDVGSNRASSVNETEYRIKIHPGVDRCDKHVIEINPTANLTEPVLMKIDLEQWDPAIDDSQNFTTKLVRFSEDSILHTSRNFWVVRDCGSDFICTPNLVITLEAFDSVYVPGTTNRLGVKIKVINKEEPAYDAKAYLRLPLPPKRIPRSCSLEGLNMTCEVHSPLERDESEEWEVELEHTLQTVEEEVIKFKAEVKHERNVNNDTVKDVNITIVPKADFKVSGKTLQNSTMNITRDKFDEAGNVSFVHYFEITNLGPSDWVALEAVIKLPENVTVLNKIRGCNISNEVIPCEWSVPANVSLQVPLSMKYNLSKYGNYLEELTLFKATTTLTLLTERQKSFSVTTTLVLEPAKPIWPFIVAIAVSTIIGFLLLAGIVYGLHRHGFFSRTSREELKRRKQEEEECSADEEPGCSSRPVSEVNESSQELLCFDSD